MKKCMRWRPRGGEPHPVSLIALPIFHAMHRVYHGLHDLGIHPTKFCIICCMVLHFSFCRCVNITDTNALTTIVSLKAANDVKT